MALLSTVLNANVEQYHQLQKIPEFISRTLDGLGHVAQHAERYRYMAHCAVIGRGFNYSTAFEVALKIKELTRTATEPYSSADFRHGPVAMVNDGFPVILVAPHGATFNDVHTLIKDLHTLGAELLLISDDLDLMTIAHLAMPIPAGLPEWLTPIIAVLPGQIFAMSLAKVKGLDPDKPVGLKKVTETR